MTFAWRRAAEATLPSTDVSAPPAKSTSDARQAALRSLPSVDKLAGDAIDAGAVAPSTAHSMLVQAARAAIDSARAQIIDSNGSISPPTTGHLLDRLAANLDALQRPVLAPVINASGVILHTGLGRAPLGPALTRAAASLNGRYVPVEIDMDTGRRGKRRRVVEPAICALTGAQAATVVNNNAAAILVTLGALAGGREVIVSRGELVEIGGSFRLPEIIETGGAHLREVGTTNCTRAADYERAVSEHVGAIMKVHPSNYRVEGFAEEATLEQLVAIGRAHDLPVVHDIGSGVLTEALRDAFGVDEPTAERSLALGADLVLFSGDKLLGGPQAGIIAGRADLISRIEGHPLMRALRVDKLTLSVLAETLAMLRDPQKWEHSLPALRLIRRPLDELRRRAGQIAESLQSVAGFAAISVVDSEASVGGGSAPGHAIPSIAIRVQPSTISEGDLCERLRAGRPGVIARASDGAVLLDLRTVHDDEFDALVAALREALGTPLRPTGRSSILGPE